MFEHLWFSLRYKSRNKDSKKKKTKCTARFNWAARRCRHGRNESRTKVRGHQRNNDPGPGSELHILSVVSVAGIDNCVTIPQSAKSEPMILLSSQRGVSI